MANISAGLMWDNCGDNGASFIIRILDRTIKDTLTL
jgi:hypothetical protein